MSTNENEPKKSSAKALQIILGIGVLVFVYNQYVERQEKALLSAYTPKDVDNAMKNLAIKQAEIAKKKKEEAEVKVAPVAEAAKEELPPAEVVPRDIPLVIEKEIITQPIEQKIEEVKPVVVEEPVKAKPKIVFDENIYTPPPSYNYSGKGLVYNCVDKHWACVDGIAYTACTRNMTWNKKHNKSVECIIQEVYASTVDCEVMQTQNISQAKSTAFCSPNKNIKKKKTKR